MRYPLKFRPILKSLIWGGEKIKSFKSLDVEQTMIGESWELSGVDGNESIVTNGELAGRSIKSLLSEYGANLVGKSNYERFGDEFPLLIKFIDAKQDLSIQVHPNDELAKVRHNSKGKSEMWYVIDADEGAKLRSGFAAETSAAEYLASVESDTVTDILQEYEVAAGDLFFLPAGRVHSIGAGCLIAEIQQTSNITYRIYDFNRKDANGATRELHTELAVDAIDYTFERDYRTKYDRESRNAQVKMVDCDYFKTSIYNLTDGIILDCRLIDSFVIFICVEGYATINGEAVQRGETVLISALTSKININTEGCKLIETHI
ncbi:MAG: type I phosphomannose isomerase catalytic subunit [Rikenellaceae bacterium]